MKILRKPEVEEMTGLCERALRDLEADGRFPRRFQIAPGGRAIGWLESEVTDWIAARAATRVAA